MAIKIGGQLVIDDDQNITADDIAGNTITIDEIATIANIELSGKINITSASTRNVCIGTWSTGNPDVTGSVDNITIGADAGDKLRDGAYQNILIGSDAGKFLETGWSNVIIGHSAGESMSVGYANTCIGDRAGQSITGGYGHICIGLFSGTALEDSSTGCVYIGNRSTASSASAQNEIVIIGGSPTLSATGKGDDTILLGDSDVTDVYLGADTQANLRCAEIHSETIKLTGSLDITTNNSSGWAATFFNEGGDHNRYGVYIRAGQATPTGIGGCTWLGFADGDDDPIATITTSSATTAVIYQLSDERLKKNIKNTTVNGLDNINSLQLKSFDWKYKHGSNKIGLIAQDVEALNNDISDIASVYRPPEKDEDFHMVSFDSTIPYLIKAVQELSQQIEELKSGN